MSQSSPMFEHIPPQSFSQGFAENGLKSKTWVLYHANCLDGFGAAWAAWKALGDATNYRPVHHGDPLPQIPEGQRVFILDFCYPPELLTHLALVIGQRQRLPRNFGLACCSATGW